MDKFLNRILNVATNEMKDLKHPYVGSEHLLLSLLKEEDVIDICMDYDLSYESFKDEIILVIGKSNMDSSVILRTPLLNSIIKDFKNNVKEYNTKEYSKLLLYTLLESGDGIAVRILINMGIDVDSLFNLLKNNFSLISKNLNKYLYEFSDSIDLVNRDSEINSIIEILFRKNKNNVLLIGEAGVGKTAIIEYLSKCLDKYKLLKGYKIYNLDLSLLLSGTKYRGDFEERLNNVISDISNKKIILFIDEIHNIIGAGGSEGAIDASNILKPYLARGSIKIIGATTNDEYEKYIKKDKAFDRRFDIVNICEPNRDMTFNILNNIKNKFKKYYNINITKKNINDILDYSNKFLLNKKNPDKSIDLLDSVCSYINNSNKSKICINDIINVIERKLGRKIVFNKEIILNNINSKLYGQENNISLLYDNIINNKISLLLGGIGVGKTYSINLLCNEFGYNLINIDCNLYNLYNIYNGEESLYKVLKNDSVIFFDNVEKCNDNLVDIIIKVIQYKKILNKDLNNCIFILSATNNISYNLGFCNDFNEIEYDNKKIINLVDNIIRFNNIDLNAISKFIEYNNINNFDFDKCDYLTYGFKGVNLYLKTESLLK